MANLQPRWTVLDEHGVNYPSALARGDLSFLQALNFFALGVLALVFGQGLRTQFVHRRSGAIATAGLVAVGLAGPFSAFATVLPGESATWHGLLHGIGFLLLMLGSAVTFVASGLALRGAAGWDGYWVYSLVNAPLATAVFVALSPLGQVSFYALVVLLLAWFAVMGLSRGARPAVLDFSTSTSRSPPPRARLGFGLHPVLGRNFYAGQAAYDVDLLDCERPPPPKSGPGRPSARCYRWGLGNQRD